MSNPITALVGWLIARPLASHAVVATLETLALSVALGVAGIAYAPLAAAVVVSTFYYGREAGQREHDLKHATPPASGFAAFLGAEYAFGWGIDNFKQWLAAAGASAAVGGLLALLIR